MNSYTDTTFQDGSTSPTAGTIAGTGCAFCQSETAKQGAFFVAIVLFALCWHAHLYSVLE